MPRSSSSPTRSSSSSSPSSRVVPARSSYSYSSPKSPALPPVQHHTMQVQQPGFFSNMWQGFGLGAGQSIAFNMFRSDPVVKHVHEGSSQATPSSGTSQPKEYVQCMKESNNNAEACKQYLEQVETKLK
jgi:hypothetical protein